MKRFINFLLIFYLFLISSCSFTNNLNTILLTLPYSNNVSKAAGDGSTEETVDDGVVYNFEVSLTDSSLTVQTKSAKSGEQILFSDIPVGTATISITAYDDKNVACYSGGATFEVIEGENQISVPIKKIVNEDENKDEDKENPKPETEPEQVFAEEGESIEFEDEDDIEPEMRDLLFIQTRIPLSVFEVSDFSSIIQNLMIQSDMALNGGKEDGEEVGEGA